MGRFEQEAPFILYFLVFTWRSTHGATEKLAMRDGSLCVLPPSLSLSRVRASTLTRAYPHDGGS